MTRQDITFRFHQALTVIGCLAISGMMLSSCDSFLDTTDEQTMPAHEELTSLEALRATTGGLYAQPWYYFHKNRFYQLGDCRANNLFISTSDTNDNNTQASMNEDKENTTLTHSWGSLYNVITQAGYIIYDYAPYCVKQGICTQAEANECLAEARFMRALAYWYLAMYWHDVPIVEDASKMSPTLRANRFEDVLQYAICDAEFAREWLPQSPSETGRVSKVSAAALLSRLYLTAGAWAKGSHYSSDFKSRVLDKWYEGDEEYQVSLSLDEFYYAKAASSARTAIKESTTAGYGLMDDYEQIFRVQNNNCKESLFALQVVPGSTTYGLANELQGAFCYDRCLDNNYGMAWSTWASYDFMVVAEKRGGLNRTRGNVFPLGFTYDYLYHELDTCQNHLGCKQGDVWKVGKSGSSSGKYLPIRKWIMGGPLATNNQVISGNSGFCTPLIRMSEVYLNLTEALMGLYDQTETADNRCLEGVNTIRQRAYKYEIANGTYPGDYGTTGGFNLDSLLQERRMEFFVEGLYWSDIVRRSFMGEEHLQHMLDYINNKLVEQDGDPIMGCHRLYQYKYTPASTTSRIGTVELAKSKGDYIIKRACRECVHNISNGSYCHSSKRGDADNLWSMIYPPAETSQDPYLLLEPISYDFSSLINNK